MHSAWGNSLNWQDTREQRRMSHHKRLLPLFGILVACLFLMDNAAFSWSNVSQCVLHGIPF